MLNPSGDHARSYLSYLKIGLFYFMLVFGAGFVLAPIRILWLAPRVGNRAAELLECPVMILVTFLAARWIILRFSVPKSIFVRLGIGAFALALLAGAEITVGMTRRGMSLRDVIVNRDPVSGSVYFLSLTLFCLMPAFVQRR
jgi:hypothetical protein